MDHKLKNLLIDAPALMGIVNVTPDSFSDGGMFISTDKAIAHGMAQAGQGAKILDIGGESTRPGAQAVDVEEELRRVIPVIEGLKKSGALLSVDTRNARTMEAALAAGADIINDISALMHNPKSIDIIAQSGAPVCLMHMQGQPQTMQSAPHYDDVLVEVLRFFEQRLDICAKAGIKTEQIILDPGIGFGKTVEHNLTLIKNLKELKRFNLPVLLGVSRKRFIAAISNNEEASDRLPGSIAAALWGIENGADILRIHDVSETAQAIKTYQAINTAR
ncbi:MAG: dihydropteroate synthase [Alphaproteobacteria bacterium]|nr:dihydropteroate synthase [Alphaproteobacteria bacterium]